jgi:hypothetical protein
MAAAPTTRPLLASVSRRVQGMGQGRLASVPRLGGGWTARGEEGGGRFVGHEGGGEEACGAGPRAAARPAQDEGGGERERGEALAGPPRPVGPQEEGEGYSFFLFFSYLSLL